MGSSGGSIGDGIKSFAEDTWNDPLGQTLNIATQYMTYGLVGYEDGKFTQGVATQALDEGLGEITGRNMQREELWKNDVRLQAERQQRELDLQNQRREQEEMDRAASSAARAARAPFGGGRSRLRFDNISDEKDFLGI